MSYCGAWAMVTFKRAEFTDFVSCFMDFFFVDFLFSYLIEFRRILTFHSITLHCIGHGSSVVMNH